MSDVTDALEVENETAVCGNLVNFDGWGVWIDAVKGKGYATIDGTLSVEELEALLDFIRPVQK